MKSKGGGILLVSLFKKTGDSGYKTRVQNELHLTSADDFHTSISLVTYILHKKLNIIKLLFSLKTETSRRKINLLHAHNLYSTFFSLVIKFLSFNSFKLIFDVHGLVPQEYVWLKKGKIWGAGFLCLKIMERLCASKSDYLICASRSLKVYFEERYPVKNKIEVIPNLSPFPERGLKELNKVKLDLKKKLCLADIFVLLHIGSFLQWTDAENTIEIFRKLREFLPKVFLIIVTYEKHEKISSFLMENKIIASEFLITHVPHHEIPQYAPIGDLGLIIRDNSLINQVAFPTKFSEYLACGVPVLCSSSIKDIAKDVKKHGLGYVLTDNELNADNLKHLSSKRNLEKMRKNCITYFAQELVRVKIKLQRIYTELTTNIDL